MVVVVVVGGGGGGGGGVRQLGSFARHATIILLDHAGYCQVKMSGCVYTCVSGCGVEVGWGGGTGRGRACELTRVCVRVCVFADPMFNGSTRLQSQKSKQVELKQVINNLDG